MCISFGDIALGRIASTIITISDCTVIITTRACGRIVGPVHASITSSCRSISIPIVLLLRTEVCPLERDTVELLLRTVLLRFTLDLLPFVLFTTFRFERLTSLRTATLLSFL